MALPSRILSYSEIVKGECKDKRKDIFFSVMALPSRILSYSEIAKDECNSKRENEVFTEIQQCRNVHSSIYENLF